MIGIVQPFREIEERVVVEVISGFLSHAFKCCFLSRYVFQFRRELDDDHRRIAAAAQQQETLTPDAEWLLDNYHIVAETLREIRHDLPRGYYQQLPKLAGGPCDGLPRVYAVATALLNLDETITKG